MADFNITRGEGLATVNSKLAAIAYISVLAGWEHASGAWLVIGHVPAHPNNYTVHWRSIPTYLAPVLQFVDAFECADPDVAWARALKSAESAWTKGASPVLYAAAEKSRTNFKESLARGGTRGGQKSGKVRQEMSEARKEAEELGRRYKILFVPQFDPRAWTFSPMHDVKNRPVIQFAWKKMKTTFAYMALTDNGQAWNIGREWHPGMNDDNAPISEICFRDIGDSLHKDDPAVQMLERLLKTDPEKWLKGDYVRFA